MPGKLCEGPTLANLVRTPLPMIAQASCDGRAVKLAGGSATENPWDNSADNDANKPLEEAWDRGFITSSAGCCAE